MKKNTKPQRGRPPGTTGKAKTEVIQFRANALEKQAFAQAAADAGLSVASWLRERVRQVCRDELEKNGRRVSFLSSDDETT